MSLGIAFKGPEGIVLAADSRVTLMAQIPGENMLVPATYDNATKLLKIAEQKYVGAVTYGLGAIGQSQPRTAHSYIPELEEKLKKEGVGRLQVKDFAHRLSAFFLDRWTDQMPPGYSGPDMVFLVGGYDDGAPYGSVFEFHIPKQPDPHEWHVDTFGMVWGGQREFADRIIRGFDDQLLQIVQQTLKVSDPDMATLRGQLGAHLQARIPFAFLPLQDCVDLSIFMIRATILIQNWLVGVRGVGGAIDVATITRTEGFDEVQRKIIVGETK